MEFTSHFYHNHDMHMPMQARVSFFGSWIGSCISSWFNGPSIPKTEHLKLYFWLIQKILVSWLCCWILKAAIMNRILLICFQGKNSWSTWQIVFSKMTIPYICFTTWHWQTSKKGLVYALLWPFETEWTIVNASANTAYQKWHYIFLTHLSLWMCTSRTLDQHVKVQLPSAPTRENVWRAHRQMPKEPQLLLVFSHSIVSNSVLVSNPSQWAWVLNRVWLFVTPWTVACQTPLSMGFPKQEY